MSLFGSPAGAQDRARRFSRSARTASIRYATVLGSLFAFTLLCIVSMRANAEPLVEEGARAPFAGDPHPVAALAVRDAVGTVAQQAGGANADGVAVDTDDVGVSPAEERHASQDPLAVDARNDVIAWRVLFSVLLALAGLTIVAFGGWCRARAALKLVSGKLRSTETEWQRRHAAVEAREHAARTAAGTQASAAARQEHDRILTAMRHFVGGPLSALVGLLAGFDTASPTPAQRTLVRKIQSATRTCVRALEDMLSPSPIEPCEIVLDEDSTDLRELIDGVVALFSPAAAQRGLRLSVSVDQSVAARVLTDSARLGQIVFHLLSRAVQATEHGQITIVVRARPLNAGSQRIFISVRDVGARALPSAQSQLPGLSNAGERVEDQPYCDGDAGFVLCRLLTQRMGGELTVETQPGFGTCATFAAPFAIESLLSFAEEEATGNAQVPPQAVAAQLAQGPAAAPVESFDPSYLDALSNEGIDLHTFIQGWRRSMIDDLERMHSMHNGRDVALLRAALHRLSGAVGLVGASSLMDALRQASAAQPEPETDAIDTLAKRAEALMMQLDQARPIPEQPAMTRPLALIEGDLTIPLPRPFDGLPPPFGTRRRVMREAVQQAVEQVAKPARAFLFPPTAKHILFYKAPPQRADNGRWDAALEEAKRYLEMNTIRPRSSRSDHLLAASIVAGCTIALTWLLVTCSMKEAEKAKAVLPVPTFAPKQVAQIVPTPPAVSQQTAKATSASSDVSKQLVQAEPLSPVGPKRATQVLARQTVQVIARSDEAGTPPAKPAKRVKVARLSEAHVNERMALSQATQPAAQAAMSKQPEWTAGASRSRDDVSTDDAAWMNWSTQQHRPSPTIRAATPLDNSWNDYMTQRRITDDPAAFHADGGRQ